MMMIIIIMRMHKQRLNGPLSHHASSVDAYKKRLITNLEIPRESDRPSELESPTLWTHGRSLLDSWEVIPLNSATCMELVTSFPAGTA
mmetsp:Transcript_9250/g.15917  ORF Transcript_9250/g.15917 Transcript_9250/m.15917 type:complete len:88 (-) Transcript_9250:453-716(-)